MALDQTDICNLALTRIGWKTLISSIDDEGTEAAMCKLYYSHCLQMALTKADWNFARKRVALVEEAGDPPRSGSTSTCGPPTASRLFA